MTKQADFPAFMTVKSSVISKPVMQLILKELRNHKTSKFDVIKLDAGYEVFWVHPIEEDCRRLVLRSMIGAKGYLVRCDINLLK